MSNTTIKSQAHKPNVPSLKENVVEVHPGTLTLFILHGTTRSMASLTSAMQAMFQSSPQMCNLRNGPESRWRRW